MATIADVARLAGVSKSTASRVLNDAPTAVRISEDTRRRILQAADELRYRGNPFARAIRSARSQLLGVVSVSLVHPFWVSVIERIEEVARERGYYLLLSESSPSWTGAVPSDLLTANGINALLLLGDVALDDRWLDSAASQGKAIVTVACDLDHPKVPAVALDNRRAIDLALEHLTALGHERIVLHGSVQHWEGRQRIEAFRDFFRRRGRPAPVDFLRQVGQTLWSPSLARLLADGVDALDEFLARPEPPTAVISLSSLRATGLVGQAYRRGVRVPEKLSVIAFGDSALAEHAIPRLTAIDERVAEHGRLAASLVLDMLEQKVSASGLAPTLLEPHLVIRESTGPVPVAG